MSKLILGMLRLEFNEYVSDYEGNQARPAAVEANQQFTPIEPSTRMHLLQV
jgi:hypothetical protein